MKILLLGGTGVIGSELALLLTQNSSNNVYVTTRGDKISNNPRLQYLKGNAHKDIFFNELFREDWDVVVDFMVYDTYEFKNRVDRILDKVRQYIYISTARVYANEKDFLTEESFRLLDVCSDKMYITTEEYALSKARQENILIEHNKKNWTIIRPYITYGPSRLELEIFQKEGWLYRCLNGKTIVFAEDIGQKYTTMSSSKNVAFMISGLICNKLSYGEIYHIAPACEKKWEEVLNVYCKTIEEQIGVKPKVKYVKKGSTITNGWPKYNIIYDRLYDRKFNNEKIKNIVPCNEIIEIETGLKMCMEEFLNNPKFNNIDWKEEGLKDRITHEKTKITDIQGIRNRCQYIAYRYTPLSRVRKSIAYIYKNIKCKIKNSIKNILL